MIFLNAFSLRSDPMQEDKILENLILRILMKELNNNAITKIMVRIRIKLSLFWIPKKLIIFENNEILLISLGFIIAAKKGITRDRENISEILEISDNIRINKSWIFLLERRFFQIKFNNLLSILFLNIKNLNR